MQPQNCSKFVLHNFISAHALSCFCLCKLVCTLYSTCQARREITGELCCIIFWVRGSQSSSGWFASPRKHFACCQSEIQPVKGCGQARAPQPERNWKSSMSELNLDFAEVSCILPESSKAAGTYCFWVVQRQHPPSQVPLKLSIKGFLSGWQHGKVHVTLWQTPLLASCKESVPLLCENNDQVFPEIISQELFLAKEKCCLSVCLGKNCQIHMANPKYLWFMSQIFQNNGNRLKMLLCSHQWGLKICAL